MTWHLTAAERVANAKKAAATRRREGIKPFGGKYGKGGWKHMTPEQRHLAHMKALATMKARGEKIGFARFTPAQRAEAEQKAIATKRARGEL